MTKYQNFANSKWRTAAILKIVLGYISTIYCPINAKFGMEMQNHTQPQVTWPQYHNEFLFVSDYMLAYRSGECSELIPVQQGFFDICGLCQIQNHAKHSRPRPRTSLKAKAKNLMHQGQGEGPEQGLWPSGPRPGTNITGLRCLTRRRDHARLITLRLYFLGSTACARPGRAGK